MSRDRWPDLGLPSRDTAGSSLESQVRAALFDDLRIEQDLDRWFPVWGAPGL